MKLEDLLQKAMTAKHMGRTCWYATAPKDVQAFTDAVVALKAQHKPVIMASVMRVLRDDLGFMKVAVTATAEHINGVCQCGKDRKNSPKKR